MFRKMRRFKQAVTKEECVKILTETKRGVLSVIGDGGYPYGIPMDFYYDENEDTIYFHCAKEGHKIDAVKSCDKVCFSTWNEGYQKDGDWSWYVTSVVAMGRAKLVTDPAVTEEKIRLLGLKYYPDAQEVEQEIKKDGSRVQLLSLAVEHMTGKFVHEK